MKIFIDILLSVKRGLEKFRPHFPRKLEMSTKISIDILLPHILGDPGAVSRAGLKGATKVFKHGRKSPWVPTLTGPFPNGQAIAGS